MFHDHHVLKNGMYLPFCFFYVLPKASYGYIHVGFIPSTVWRFFKYFFQLLRCRNSAWNRFFSYFSLEAGMFHTWGASIHPLYIWMLPVCSDPPYVQTPLVCPKCSPVYLYVLGVSICDRGCRGHLMFGHPHVFDTSPCVQHPQTFICSAACLCSRGYCTCYGDFPYVGVLGGFSTSVRLLVSVNTSIGCPLCSICSFSDWYAFQILWSMEKHYI